MSNMWRSLTASFHKRGRSAARGTDDGKDVTILPEPDEHPGLHPLNPNGNPEQRNIPESYKYTIVGIHGLGGHPYRTWTHKETGTLWLRDMLPRDIPEARIFSYGYPSQVLCNQSKAGIRDYATSLLVCLMDINADQKNRPIVFVAHSLGGIVCKQALIMAKHDARYHGIWTNTVGVLFFGTPHLGSVGSPEMGIFLRNVLTLALNASGARLFVGKPRKDLLKNLETNSGKLQEIAADFRHVAENLQIVSFTEMNEVYGRTIVNKDSALLNITAEEQIGVYENHMEMCRFSSSNKMYLTVMERIKRMLCFDSPNASIKDSDKARIGLFRDFDVFEYQSALPQAAEGTCRWVLKNSQYKSWAAGEATSFLWVSGHPGAGKTTLSSFITNYFRDSESSKPKDPLICCFFCNEGIQRQNDARAILRSVIFQILLKRQYLAKHVKKVLEIDTSGVQLFQSYERLWNVFTDIASDPKLGPLYIVIDALDECEHGTRNRLLKGIASLMKAMKDRCIKFLVTSRPYLVISNYFTDDRLCHLPLEDLHDEIDADLRIFIRERVSAIQRKTNAKQKTVDALEHSLNKTADRTFLWATFALEILDKELLTAPSDYVRILENLPRDLEAVYEHYLYGIEPQSEWFAIKLLRVIIASHRPITLSEVNVICVMDSAVEKGCHDLADLKENHLHTNVRADILKTLGPLVRISEDKVYLVHLSLKEFLCDGMFCRRNPSISARFHVDPRQGSLQLASTCMAYLSFSDFEEDLFSTDGTISSATSPALSQHEFAELEVEEGLGFLFREPEDIAAKICVVLAKKYDLFDYASRYWANHFAMSSELASDDLQQLALRLSDGVGSHQFSNWFRYFWCTSGIQKAYPVDFDPLTVSSFFGHGILIDKLRPPIELNSDQSLGNALYWASREGHRDPVIKVLETALDPNLKIVDYQSPLSVAAEHGHSEVAELLAKDWRVDVNLVDKDSRTPLSRAAGCGCTRIVEILLEHKQIEPNHPDNKLRTPLFWAIGGRHVDVVGLLARDHRTDINHADSDGRTAFSWAAVEGVKGIIDCLRKIPGIDPDRQDLKGRTPFSWAAGNGLSEMVQELRKLPSRALPDKQGRNPYSWACEAGHDACVRGMIRCKIAGIDEPDENNWTPLFWALEPLSSQTIEALLDSGRINVNHRDHSGRTAIAWAGQYGKQAIVRALLAAPDIDLSVADNEGHTPLHWAEGRGETEAMLKRHLGIEP